MLIYLQMIETPEEASKFEAIYSLYREYMYRVAIAILKNPQDAEDTVHYAFVKILENIKKVDEPTSRRTRAYAVVITRNRAIDIYRRRKAHPQVEYCDITIGIRVEYTGKDDLAACILKLNERQRSVLLMKHQHGDDLRTVAEKLGITYRNASQIEQRAKKKLMILCQEAGIEW